MFTPLEEVGLRGRMLPTLQLSLVGLLDVD